MRDRYNPINYVNLAGKLDHGLLLGLTDDDHSQYALLVGRNSGQTLIGGTASGDDLTFQTTSNITKGSYIFSELTAGFVKSNASGVLSIDTAAYITLASLSAVSPISYNSGTGAFSHVATAGNIHLPTGGSANQILKNSGTSGTGAWGTVTEASGALAAITTLGMSGQLTSTLAIGTSPFSVTSTTVNTNLNADLWDGYQFSDYLDQAVKQASSPTFVGLTLTGLTTTRLLYSVSDVLTDSAALTFDGTNLTNAGIGTFNEINIGQVGYHASTLLAVGTTNAPVNAYTSMFEVLTNVANPLAVALNSAISGQTVHPISATTPANSFGGQFWNSPSGDAKDLPAGGAIIYGLFGAANGTVTNTKSGTGGRSTTLIGMRFAATNAVDWTVTNTITNSVITTKGASVSGTFGWAAKTISGTKCQAANYGLEVTAAMDGIYNAAVAGANYGLYVSTTNNVSDATGNINSYALYLLPAAGSTESSGGVVTSWGIYEANQIQNALYGNTRIGGTTAPTVALDVTGAGKFTDDVSILADSKSTIFGAGSDMKIYYDGTNGNIDSDIVAASDLTIDCGTGKTIVLEVPVYKDINLGAANFWKPSAGYPNMDEFKDAAGNDTGIETHSFALNQSISGQFEVQHDYKEGTDLTFHVHWQGITAPAGGTDNVQWRLKYVISRDGQVMNAPTTIDSPDKAITAQYQCARSDFGAIAGATGGDDGGIIKIGDQFLFLLTRTAVDADEYAGDALLITAGVHYQIDTIGSRTISAK